MKPASKTFHFLAIASMMALTVSPAYAHKVNMFAFAEGNDVFVEGYFSDGKKPMNSEVLVFDNAGKQLLSGLTNEEGQFDFAIPKQEDLRITLNAGQGHLAEYTISREELGGVEAAPATANDALNSPGGEAVSDNNVVVETTAAAAPGLERMVKSAVGQSLRPVMRSLSELKERRTFSDIIGGLGFIVGIIGGFFYFKARKLLAQNKGSAP